ncbi:MFS transporter [Litchfieldella qijiaojingensis]|uniref:MFS transporter n=1 Tax=Litchfieldella qijiaojingensis TaxID=980347 RepID=A0ABQ2YQ08_9GAMM|nr:MFS transporter [Halomonas qijiaojingensis]GGX90056.1 MFS transporter [Halomonas qijiaojingensis]
MIIVVFATTLVLAFSSLVALYPAAIAPEVAPALGVSSATVGLQVSLIFTGAMLTALIGGPLTRRLGPCRTSQLSLLLVGLGAGLLAIPSLASFAMASLVVGFGYGLTNPAASLLLVRFTPRRHQGLIFSLKQTGVPLGGVLAGLIAPWLALAVGWQAGLLWLCLLALTGILALQAKRARWDDQRDSRSRWWRTPLAGLLVVWRQRSLRYVALISLCFSAIQLSLSAFTVSLLVEDLEIRLVAAGMVMAAIQVCGVGGRVFWGWIADRLDNPLATLGVIGIVTALGALTVAAMTPGWPLGIVAGVLCLMGGAALGWNGVYLAEVVRLAPPERVADASGGCLVFTYAGVPLGLPAFTLLHGILDSYSGVFVALAAIALLGLLLVQQARLASRRESGARHHVCSTHGG